MVALLTTVTSVEATLSNVTAAPDVKPVPVIVTAVPPASAPDGGVTPVIVGAGAMYVKALATVALCPSGLVTVTGAGPATCAEVVAAIVVLSTMVTPVAAVLPMVTCAPATKSLPVIVMAVPPSVDPDV